MRKAQVSVEGEGFVGADVSELNGYVRFMKGKKYGFVALDRATGDITTFHIKNVSELMKKAQSLGFKSR